MGIEYRVSEAAYRSLYDRVDDAGGVSVLLMPEAPRVPMLNRVTGLGVDHPATDSEIGDALSLIPPGHTFYVSLAPEAQPAGLGELLRSHGLEPGWGWMSFRRGIGGSPTPPASPTVVEVATEEQAEAFAQIVTAAYGLPQQVAPVVARAPRRGWICLLALDGDAPIGAGALFVSESAAYFGLAGTLPEHRGKGSQTALFAERLKRARGLGCNVCITETGELRDDRPSSSYRNIVRAGFEESAVTANWLGST